MAAARPGRKGSFEIPHILAKDQHAGFHDLCDGFLYLVFFSVVFTQIIPDLDHFSSLVSMKIL
jgi:hypothetical protein